MRYLDNQSKTKLLELLVIFNKLNVLEITPSPPEFLFRSSMGREIFLRLMQAANGGDYPALKVFCLGMSYAPSGIRKALRELERRGYVDFPASSLDKRCKLIKINKSLNIIFDQVWMFFSKQLDDVVNLM